MALKNSISKNIDYLDQLKEFKSISNKKLIVSIKTRKKFQKLNYKPFYLTHEFVSKIIDNVRSKIISVNKFNLNKKAKLKITQKYHIFHMSGILKWVLMLILVLDQ